MSVLNVLSLPVGENGALVDLEIQDAGARQLIAALGNAVKWLGVTTTTLVDNVTTSPDITIGDETVTATAGGMAQYNGEEFVYNGTTWQSIGKNNFGDLAFANSVTASYTPAGTISVSEAADTTESITPFGSANTPGSWAYDSTSGKATYTKGTAATAGTAVSVVTASGARTATFTGTAATITSTPPVSP